MVRKVLLPDEETPKEWYNILPDLPKPLPPPIDPSTKKPVEPAKLEVLFAKELVRQEMSNERWIKIPEEVREVYMSWGLRPSTEP